MVGLPVTLYSKCPIVGGHFINLTLQVVSFLFGQSWRLPCLILFCFHRFDMLEFLVDVLLKISIVEIEELLRWHIAVELVIVRTSLVDDV